MKTEAQIGRQYEQIRGTLHERTRGEWAGSEAMALGHGGLAKVHRATGMAPSTIGKGVRELRARESEAGVITTSCATQRWRTQEEGRPGSPAVVGAGIIGRAGDARRSGISVALDSEESSRLVAGTLTDGP